jgi:hypothetical protein
MRSYCTHARGLTEEGWGGGISEDGTSRNNGLENGETMLVTKSEGTK